MPLLSVRDLHVEYRIPDMGISIKALRGVNLDVEEGDSLAIVGESGSGKSTLALAILRMLKPPTVVKGSVLINGVDVLKLSEDEFNRRFRWSFISIVPQASQNSLNPTMRVRDHFIDTARYHGVDEREALRRAFEMLEFVKLNPVRVLNLYPHQLSGGMKQRVLIALAMFLNPKIVIMDEPTSALDVVTQLEILKLVKSINRDLKTTVIFITHDISIVPLVSSKVAVMYNGIVVESGPMRDVLANPLHPYTKALIEATPSLSESIDRIKPIPGEPPSPLEEIRGCQFWPRCPRVMDICRVEEPPDININGRVVKCHLYR